MLEIWPSEAASNNNSPEKRSHQEVQRETEQYRMQENEAPQAARELLEAEGLLKDLDQLGMDELTTLLSKVVALIEREQGDNPEVPKNEFNYILRELGAYRNQIDIRMKALLADSPEFFRTEKLN